MRLLRPTESGLAMTETCFNYKATLYVQVTNPMNSDENNLLPFQLKSGV